MLSERALTFEQNPVTMILFREEPYFRATDVTKALGYVNGSQAIRAHVEPDDIKTLAELSGDVSAVLCPTENEGNASTDCHGFKQPLYIKEYGVYALILKSKKPEAVRFHRWVIKEVLPDIGRTGSYVRNAQVSLMCEMDLHYKVVDFIRKFFEEAIVVAGLGELQDTSDKRIDAWKKGYTAGQPDILILNRARKFSGLAIEFKTPLCQRIASPKQEVFLQALQKNTYETLISNSYDEIVVKILEYREAVRRCIPRKRARSSVE